MKSSICTLMLMAGLGSVRAEVDRDLAHQAQQTNNTAAAHQESGNFRQAEKYYLEAISLWEKADLDRTEPAAISMSNLATVYRQQGRHEAALPLIGTALKILEATAGPNSLSVMTSANNLAELYRSIGDLQNAENTALRSLSIARRLPEGDVRRSHPAHTLAGVYVSQGRRAEAKELLDEALAIRERALGPDHVYVANTLTNLASVLLAEGEMQRATLLAERALAILEKRLPSTHPHLAIALNNLAQAKRLSGRHAEAEPLYRHALAISESSGASRTRDYAVMLSNLADSFHQLGKLSGAADLYRRAVRTLESVLGRDSAEVAAMQIKLAEVYRAQRRNSEADALYRTWAPLTDQARARVNERSSPAVQSFQEVR